MSVPSIYADKAKQDSFKHTCVGIMVTGWKKFDKKLETILDIMTKSQLNIIKGTHTMLVFKNGVHYKTFRNYHKHYLNLFQINFSAKYPWKIYLCYCVTQRC